MASEDLTTTGVDDEFRRLVELQEQITQEIGSFSAARRLSRDELYDRAAR